MTFMVGVLMFIAVPKSIELKGYDIYDQAGNA